jgi:hypothetical protein
LTPSAPLEPAATARVQAFGVASAVEALAVILCTCLGECKLVYVINACGDNVVLVLGGQISGSCKSPIATHWAPMHALH